MSTHENEKLDKLFSQLHDAESQEAPSNLWAKMEQKLDAEDKKGAVLVNLWWPKYAVAASVCLLIGFATWMGFQLGQNSQSGDQMGNNTYFRDTVQFPLSAPKAIKPKAEEPALALAKEEPLETVQPKAEPVKSAKVNKVKSEVKQKTYLRERKDNEAERQLALEYKRNQSGEKETDDSESTKKLVAVKAALPKAKAESDTTPKQRINTFEGSRGEIAFTESEVEEDHTVVPVLIEIRRADGKKIRPKKSLFAKAKEYKHNLVQSTGEPLNADDAFIQLSNFKNASNR